MFTGYQPVIAHGPAADHALAFDRGGAITVATRRPVGLARAGGFGDTAIELGADYVDVFTGQTHSGRARLAAILQTYPAALLIGR